MCMQIRASDINFWGNPFDFMRLKHETKMYPPRVKMIITLNNLSQSFKLQIKFIGCSHDSQLDVELTLPFCKEPIKVYLWL